MGELQMCVYVMLGIKSWASHMLGNHFTKGASPASADPSAFLFKFYLPTWFALSFLQRNHICDLLWERSRLLILPHDQCLFWVCNIDSHKLTRTLALSTADLQAHAIPYHFLSHNKGQEQTPHCSFFCLKETAHSGCICTSPCDRDGCVLPDFPIH